MREQLWRYYPQILDAVGSVVEPWALDLWAKVPTPAKARRVQRRTLESLLKRHRIRRITADQLFDILRAPAVAVAPGTTEAAVAHIRSVFERIRLVHRQLAEAKREFARLIDVLADSEDSGSGQPVGQRDVTVLSSLPGVGQTVIATLLAEAPQALARRDYKALRCMCGVASATRRSGKYKLVVRRMAAHARLAQALLQMVPQKHPRFSPYHGVSSVQWRRHPATSAGNPQEPPSPSTQPPLPQLPKPCHFRRPLLCNFAWPPTPASRS
ncbi:MAG: transposase [Gemmatimonadetes bacterium]|nr:transposase [Gemmatimonadota bacterium]